MLGNMGEASKKKTSESPALAHAPSSPFEACDAAVRWLQSTADPSPFIHGGQQFHSGLVSQPLRVLLSQPGRFVCTLRVPARLTNPLHMLHGGVIASLVDNVGAAALITLYGKVWLSIDLNVSYMSSARIDDEVEFDARVLKFGSSVGVVSVDVTNKTTGELVAQGRHTMYYPSSKL